MGSKNENKLKIMIKKVSLGLINFKIINIPIYGVTILKSMG